MCQNCFLATVRAKHKEHTLTKSSCLLKKKQAFSCQQRTEHKIKERFHASCGGGDEKSTGKRLNSKPPYCSSW